MSQAIRITDAEWDVMDVLWRQRAATAAQVIDELAPVRNWNHRTIRTMLSRLVDKGALKHDVDGNRYVYRPAISREQCLREESRSFLNKVFRGDVAALLVHFAQDAQIGPDEIERLKQILEEKRN